MLPNMFKIAGELQPCVFHVAARAVAAHALSIFGDHSDVMRRPADRFRHARRCLRSGGSGHGRRSPCMTSSRAECRSCTSSTASAPRTRSTKIDAALGRRPTRTGRRGAGGCAHAAGTLARPPGPARLAPRTRTCSSRRARRSTRFYERCRDRARAAMDRFAALTGRSYQPVRLRRRSARPSASSWSMGSGDRDGRGGSRASERRGRAGRPRQGASLPALLQPLPVAALPLVDHVAIAVLDRTKEPRRVGEPLYQDVVTALHEAAAAAPRDPRDRRPLRARRRRSSRPAMAKAVFDELARRRAPEASFHRRHRRRRHRTSLDVRPALASAARTVSGLFYGLGADGTVGANKNSVKIIGEETDRYAQGYFVYDSKKSGAVTVSHLRFGPRPIRRAVPDRAGRLRRLPPVSAARAARRARARRAAARLPAQQPVRRRRGLGRAAARGPGADRREAAAVLRRSTRSGSRGRPASAAAINTVMQTCFFALSGVLPARGGDRADQARDREDLWPQAARTVVQAQLRRRRRRRSPQLHEVEVPARRRHAPAAPTVAADAPDFVSGSPRAMIAGQGDSLPVSAPSPSTAPSRPARALGEAQHRARDPGLGPDDLHPVRQVRARLPARGDPR